MTKSTILYYPYIDMPNHIWTINSVMYWDNIATIYPDAVSNYYETDKITQELIKTDILLPITPSAYNYDRTKILNDIKRVISKPEFNIEEKRNQFNEGFQTDCYAEKFEAEIFDLLVEHNLAQKKSSDAFVVENHAANLIILLLATEISKQGLFTPSTDQDHFLSAEFFKSASIYNHQTLRNEFLEEILPCPVKVDLLELIDFKGKHESDLIDFRREIETTVETLSKIPDINERKEQKRKHLNLLNERKEYITRKLEETKFDKILLGGWSSFFIGANATIVSHDIKPLALGTVGASIGAARNLLKDETKGNSLRYVGLLEKNFK